MRIAEVEKSEKNLADDGTEVDLYTNITNLPWVKN